MNPEIIWHVTAVLGPDEHVRLTRLAAMAQGRMTKGGRLVITNHRVVFYPRRLDRLFGAHDVSVPHSAIADIGVAPRSRRIHEGGFRRRLVIRLRDGTEHLFVVNRLDDLVTRLQRELR